MAKIQHTRTYRSLCEIEDPRERLRVAAEAGRALALFGTLTAEMDASRFSCTLPGYRDTRLYFDQLLSVLAGNRTIQQAAAYLPMDPITRQSTEQHFLVHLQPEEYRRRMEDPQLRRFVALAHDQMSFGLTLFRALLAGDLKKVIVHGDTKLENFLFSTHTGRAKALVDLDTIMPHTWLSDWGDMTRSLVNVTGEKEPELDKVEVDLEVFMAAARGFLGSARSIDSAEIELMADAAQIMALELGVRFLADYLRGDSYFQLGPSDPWDLNKIRAMVQFTVFEKLQAGADIVKRYIRELASHTGIRGRGTKG
jgi:Ser/Thr protein kinase RdoA (MazF antagonist)